MKRIIMMLTMFMVTIFGLSATPIDNAYSSKTERIIFTDDEGVKNDVTMITLKNDNVFNKNDSYASGFGIVTIDTFDSIVYGLSVNGDIEYLDGKTLNISIFSYDTNGELGDPLFDMDFTEDELLSHDSNFMVLELSSSTHKELLNACFNGDVIALFVDREIYAIASLTGFTKGYNKPMKQQ